jgi:hypothetical protein
MKNVIFSAVFGMNAVYPEIHLEQWHKVILTDDPGRVNAPSCWEIRTVPKMHVSDRKSNRYYKWLSHLLFKDYDYVMYFDSSLKLVPDLNETVNHLMKRLTEESKLAVFFKHPHRNCIYDELVTIENRRMDTPQNIQYIRTHIQEDGFPSKYGLTENNVFIRFNKNEAFNEMFEKLYEFIHNHICRDQVVFMYLLYKTDLLKDIIIKNHADKIKIYSNLLMV